MTSLAYERVRSVRPSVGVVLQDNPGPMTLDGTNTWILRAPGAAASIVVDPGEVGEAHVAAVLDAAGPVELVLITHGHPDHVGAAASFAAASGAPVRAADPVHCIDGPRLRSGEIVDGGGLSVRVVATPGHTADSVCFVLGDSAVLTGDTVLGRGTTVVAHPDGALGPYLSSLRRLRDLGDLYVLPGHGPELPSIAAAADDYLAHRAQRLDQVRAALRELGPDASAREIVELVYADVDPAVWWAAELSVRAQLDYLRSP